VKIRVYLFYVAIQHSNAPMNFNISDLSGNARTHRICHLTCKPPAQTTQHAAEAQALTEAWLPWPLL